MTLLSPWLIHVALASSTFCGWMILAVLAFMPDGTWPHTGIHGNIDRALLYFLVAAATRATLTEHQTRWQISAFALAAILFEVARGWMADRSNGLSGWMSSTGGAIIGAVLLRHVAHTYL